jgi:hypothetical protein
MDSGDLSELIAWAEDRVSDLDLDDLVHDAASKHASDTNNGGVAEQVRYLAGEVGVESARAMIEEERGVS